MGEKEQEEILELAKKEMKIYYERIINNNLDPNLVDYNINKDGYVTLFFKNELNETARKFYAQDIMKFIPATGSPVLSWS